MDDLKLFKFHWSLGRMGDVYGLFAATQAQVGGIMGEEIYFGEILGKHSEVFGNIDPEDLTCIEVPPEAVAQIVAATGHTISGYNPFDYLPQE